MELRTFQARTVPEALELVRRELGPEAVVLHTRVVGDGWLSKLVGGRRYEVAAAEARPVPPAAATPPDAGPADGPESAAAPSDRRAPALRGALPADDPDAALLDMPEGLFQTFVDLVEAEADEAAARAAIALLQQAGDFDAADPQAARRRLRRLLADVLPVTGPIRLVPGVRRTVALVGPTGVGKTTTIAKLAAAFRLQQQRKVGLITVDTYRIAAVEQLRTYAEIIDLPMEVVGTPREMRQALARLQGFDLVLIDTAGRSPRDEVKIRELRAFLQEAEPDEIHLVLSAASSGRGMAAAIERFAPAGVTAALVTKLDEASCLGHLLAPWHAGRLPISYLTDGQNVPDDICVAEAAAVAAAIVAPAETSTPPSADGLREAVR